MCANCSDASKPFEPVPSTGTSESADLWPDLEWTDEGVKWASH